jgi:hypothetical protein
VGEVSLRAKRLESYSVEPNRSVRIGDHRKPPRLSLFIAAPLPAIFAALLLLAFQMVFLRIEFFPFAG